MTPAATAFTSRTITAFSELLELAAKLTPKVRK